MHAADQVIFFSTIPKNRRIWPRVRQRFYCQKITETLKMNIFLKCAYTVPSFFSKNNRQKENLKFNFVEAFFHAPKMGNFVFDLVKGKTNNFLFHFIFSF